MCNAVCSLTMQPSRFFAPCAIGCCSCYRLPALGYLLSAIGLPLIGWSEQRTAFPGRRCPERRHLPESNRSERSALIFRSSDSEDKCIMMLRSSLHIQRLRVSLHRNRSLPLCSRRFQSTGASSTTNAIASAVDPSSISETISSAVEVTPELGWKMSHIAMYVVDQVLTSAHPIE